MQAESERNRKQEVSDSGSISSTFFVTVLLRFSMRIVLQYLLYNGYTIADEAEEEV